MHIYSTPFPWARFGDYRKNISSLGENGRPYGANGDEWDVGLWIAIANDDVVKKRHTKRFARVDEAARKREVLVAWRGGSSGVVVRDDYALRPATDGALEDFARMDERPSLNFTILSG